MTDEAVAPVELRPKEVHLPPLSPDRFRELLDPEAWRRFEGGMQLARRVLKDRVVLNVNSTASGGGVAEMLRSFVPYSRGSGVDMRWAVIAGTPEFYRVTKRLHNFLHGSPGDGGDLGEAQLEVYRSVTDANAVALAPALRSDDVVLLHDPQTAGLVHRLKQTGATVVWRCHVGAERPNEYVERAWSFLAPQLDGADACIFSRHAYVPSWAKNIRTEVIPPSIDAFSPKNQQMDSTTVEAILLHVGLVGGTSPKTVPTFVRNDGSPGRVDHVCEIVRAGPPPPLEEPLVVQVSRWDRLKDPIGVMLGFAEHVVGRAHARLVLAGPSVDSVADDPEGAQILEETEQIWRKLPEAERQRIDLACIPMVEIEENAAIVNALQRHATVAVQKSLQEGFGLTVAEAMWKSRPVVASDVGGIRDQIEHGVTGIMLPDPTDLETFGDEVVALLSDPTTAKALGHAAHDRVRKHFLLDRHAIQYAQLFKELLVQP